MATFEIIIQRKSDTGWPVICLETRAGEFLPVRSEGILQIDLVALLSCVLPGDYGAQLGKAVFREEVRDGFARALAQARTSGEPLRTLLTVEDAALKSVHWERLHAPYDAGRWDFLALRQETPFSLYLPSLTDRRFPAIGRRDLRCLLLVAGPEDLAGRYPLDPIDVPAVVEAVKQSLGSVPCDVLAGVPGASGRPDLNSLCEHVTAGRYSMLHIVCHAAYDSKTGETRLYLPGEGGKPVTATALIERLSRLQAPNGLPHFTYLMACESASPEAENGLGGLGQRLVRDLGMPAVLAMTAPVSMETANRLAGAFYARLYEHGEPDRALSEALAGLMARYDVTVPAIFSRLGGRALFSDALTRPLTPTEIQYGLERLAALTAERAPAMQETVTVLAARLGGLVDEAGLTPQSKLEREALLQETGVLCEQITDLTFPALALGRPVPAYDERCPFPGLAPFHPEDRAFFFGREALVQTLVRRLREQPFLAVLGASGSGKSSVVLAGLVPALGGTYLYMTPGADPLIRLQTLLAQPGSDGTLLVVDQFEELFTLCREEPARKSFLEQLIAETGSRPVVITMRADFLGECAPYPALRAAIQAHTELVAPIDAAGMRRTIEQQAAATGLRFEAGLADDILEDVGAEPGAMPLMQHALLLLWQRRRGRWLLQDEYRAFGKVREAIAHTADTIYNGLSSPAEKDQMRAIFLRLTRLDAEEVAGSTHRDTRRRAALDELVPAGGSREDTLRLVSRLADARLVISGANPVSGKEEVEVAHEALIRYWPLLRRWLDEDRDALRAWENIREAAQDWESEQRDENLLVHRGGRLEDALALEKGGKYPLSQQELDYLHACRALVEKERRAAERRRRTTVIAAVAVAAIMMVLAVWGVGSASDAQVKATQVANQVVTAQYERGRAEANAGTATVALGLSEMRGTEAAEQAEMARTAQANAEAQAQISLGRQLAVQGRNLLDNSPYLFNTSALLAVEAYRRDPESLTAELLSDTLDLLPRPVSHIPILLDNTLNLSPDGKRLVATSIETLEDGREQDWLTAWDTVTGEPVWQVKTDIRLTSITFRKDSKTMVASGGMGDVRLLEMTSGRAVQKFDLGENLNVYSPVTAISPDGKWVMAFGESGSVVVWDAATGAEVSRKMLGGSGGDEMFYTLEFSPDGKWAVAGSSFTTKDHLQVWEPSTGKTIASFTIPEDQLGGAILHDIGFCDSGIRVFYSYDLSHIYVLDILNNQPVFDQPTDTSFQVATMSADCRKLALGYSDGQIRIMGGDSGWEMAKMSAQGQIETLLFTEDGLTVFSKSGDQTIRRWSIASAHEVIRYSSDPLYFHLILPEHGLIVVYNFEKGGLSVLDMTPARIIKRTSNARVHTLYSSEDLRWTVGVTNDNHAITWDTATLKETARVHLQAPVSSLTISMDGTRAGATNVRGDFQVWDTQTGQVIASMSDVGRYSTVQLSLDGRRAISSGLDEQENKLWILWDIDQGTEITRKIEASVIADAISSDGKTIAWTTQENAVVLWNLAEGQEVKRSASLTWSAPVLRFNLDGSRLFVLQVTGETLEAWDAQTGEMRFAIPFVPYGIYFSPDSRYALFISTSLESTGLYLVYDMETGQKLGEIALPDLTNEPVISPDGWYLLAPGTPNRIYELATGKYVVSLYTGKAYAIPIFLPDGRSILAQDENGDLVIQYWRPEDLMPLACARLERNLTEEEWKTYIGDQAAYRETCER